MFIILTVALRCFKMSDTKTNPKPTQTDNLIKTLTMLLLLATVALIKAKQLKNKNPPEYQIVKDKYDSAVRKLKYALDAQHAARNGVDPL